jgi:hypothetical protein
MSHSHWEQAQRYEDMNEKMAGTKIRRHEWENGGNKGMKLWMRKWRELRYEDLNEKKREQRYEDMNEKKREQRYEDMNEKMAGTKSMKTLWKNKGLNI